MNMNNLLTTEEFARKVGCSSVLVRYYVGTGIIGHLGKKGTFWLFDDKDVVAFRNRVDRRVTHGRRRKKTAG